MHLLHLHPLTGAQIHGIQHHLTLNNAYQAYESHQQPLWIIPITIIHPVSQCYQIQLRWTMRMNPVNRYLGINNSSSKSNLTLGYSRILLYRGETKYNQKMLLMTLLLLLYTVICCNEKQIYLCLWLTIIKYKCNHTTIIINKVTNHDILQQHKICHQYYHHLGSNWRALAYRPPFKQEDDWLLPWIPLRIILIHRLADHASTCANRLADILLLWDL